MCYNHSRNRVVRFMIFCKKIPICLLILTICFISAGCNHADKKSYFNRESVYEHYTHSSEDNTKPKRVGNVIYLGTHTESSPIAKKEGEISFEFEDLKR